MQSRFFCELRYTLSQPTHSSKETSYFVFEAKGGSQYKVGGVSVSGKLKDGSAVYKPNEKDDPDSNDYRHRIEGDFFEGDVSIRFEFEYNLISEEAYLGGGVWTEYGPSDKLRQKYNVVLKGEGAPFDSNVFFSSIFEERKALEDSYKSLQESNNRLYERLNEQSSKLSEVEKLIASHKLSVQKFSEVTSHAEKLGSDASSLLKLLTDEKNQASTARQNFEDEVSKISVLNTKSEKALGTADSTLEKANAVLGRSVSAGLAQAFVKRKREASTLKWVYDVAFLFSVCVAIGFAISFFVDYFGDNLTPDQSIAKVVTHFPILALFVWLGVFVAKKSAAMSRLEEFYAQKQALAESFEGYREEIEKLPDDERGKEDLIRLMTINLLSISRDSSEVLDKVAGEKQHPLQELFTDVMARMVGKGPK
ncbi:hypothetical protein QO259_01210 [Salinicola sp. JS01]|uniref:hypothetical protein n=1 Tax=Salinicola sp. JS01 TaxID=3050071 RepID=UPI00255B5908|nr:hypothetical protein [Salinicola sp. JS01]WIX33306.1 hypothetical protein QO259_01210 [Salinicola sp. JS01]